MSKEDLEDMGIKKTLKFLPVVIVAGILYSCGTGGGAENGASVVVELKSISPTTAQIDLFDLVDSNGDGTCDYYLIPTQDTLISATFNVKSINPEKINPSDVNIYKYELSFSKEDEVSPTLKPLTLNMSCTAVVDQDTTCQATAVPLKLKKCILDYMVFANIANASYGVNIKFYGNEVLYDNNINISGYFRFDAGHFGDDGCTVDNNLLYSDINNCECCQYIDDPNYCAGC